MKTITAALEGYKNHTKNKLELGKSKREHSLLYIYWCFCYGCVGMQVKFNYFVFFIPPLFAWKQHEFFNKSHNLQHYENQFLSSFLTDICKYIYTQSLLSPLLLQNVDSHNLTMEDINQSVIVRYPYKFYHRHWMILAFHKNRTNK